MATILNQLGKQFCKTFNIYCPNLLQPSSTSLATSNIRFLASKKSPLHFENLPPFSPWSSKGHTFSTEIKRKRVIQDPNLPSLDSVGELKWTTWKMLRDVRRRRVFNSYYPFRQCYYNIRKNRILPEFIRVEARKCEQKLPRNSTFHALQSRCSMTGRSRGNFKRYRLSRFIWRDLADYNKLSGVIKACWG